MIKHNNDYKKIVKIAANYYNKKDYKNSLEQLLTLKSYNEKNLKIHELLVYNYLHLERLEEAENEFKIYNELSKENNITLELRSFDELVEGFDDEEVTLEEYKNVILKDVKDIDFSDTKTVMNLGLIYMSQKKYKKAANLLSEFKLIIKEANLIPI